MRRQILNVEHSDVALVEGNDNLVSLEVRDHRKQRLQSENKTDELAVQHAPDEKKIAPAITASSR